MSDSSSSQVPEGHPFRSKGRSKEGWIRAFFGGNAALTIVILILIIAFLLREGLGFFPDYRDELRIYRKAGLEWVDLARKDLTAQEQMNSLLGRAYFEQVNSQCRREIQRSQEATALVNYLSEATSPARDALERVKGEEGSAPTAPAELLLKLEAKYRDLLQQAMQGRFGKGLPSTPHLSEEEIRKLVDQFAARAPLSDEDPAMLAELLAAQAAKRQQAALPYTAFKEAADAYQSTSGGLDALIQEVSETVKATKESAALHEIEVRKRETLLEAAKKAKDKPELKASLERDAAAAVTTQPVDFAASIAPVRARLGEFREANVTMSRGLDEILGKLPESLSDEKANRYLRAFRAAAPALKTELADTVPAMEAWNPDEPVGIWSAISGFITGRRWITGGEWQDFYGILPLFAGSVMISLIALLIAIPFGVGAAIYTNQFAGPRQQRFVKPTIEFLQAIPSVVLGFLGIAVLGTSLQELSNQDWLSWMPGFPIQQRLNMFTAGCLLGLMAIPTIFTLSEDAINNVPTSFSEASEALGASKLQTVFRVMVPAAISGIVAAVLLGLGRVIGETMVVLLVAGNRIQIPDFTEGLGAVFQPAHTLTGIIAQELGEVPFGSVHYRALFVVGILLFVMVLLINWTAQRLMHRLKVNAH